MRTALRPEDRPLPRLISVKSRSLQCRLGRHCLAYRHIERPGLMERSDGTSSHTRHIVRWQRRVHRLQSTQPRRLLDIRLHIHRCPPDPPHTTTHSWKRVLEYGQVVRQRQDLEEVLRESNFTQRTGRPGRDRVAGSVRELVAFHGCGFGSQL